MRSNGMMHPFIFDVNDSIFLAGLPDDFADGRIMYM
jgi:hypothetical protein